jgi:hypothetical protein
MRDRDRADKNKIAISVVSITAKDFSHGLPRWLLLGKRAEGTVEYQHPVCAISMPVRM